MSSRHSALLRPAIGAFGLLLACSTAWPAATMDFPGLGTITIEQPSGPPRAFVIFLSGDGGWNQGVVAMARHLADAGSLVAGVDVRQMAAHATTSHDACVNSAEVLEELSHFVQQKYGMRQYALPILVGYSSGATLAYGTLAQSPPGTFGGAVSLGFCPDLEWRKPLCTGNGLQHDPAPKVGFEYRPAPHLQEPWIVLQGAHDEVCDAAVTREFAHRVPGATLLMLPKVGHGYSVEQNWLPQFMDAYHTVANSGSSGKAVLPADVDDLPLIELPAGRAEEPLFAVLLSGDGGWAGLDKAVAGELNARGVPVVGWDSLRYFWNARTPDGAAQDIDRVIRHYARSWGKSAVLLVGYSQGADVMPFMLNRMPEPSRRMVAGTALLGVSNEAFFEFSVSHWIGHPTGGVPVLPEIRAAAALHLGQLSCIYGAEDEDSPCRQPGMQGLRPIMLPGGHHFRGDYGRVAAAVLEGLAP